MTATVTANVRRTWPVVILGIVIAIVLSGVGTTVVSLITRAAGASPDFRPLQPATYLFLASVGVLIGALGWWIVSRTRRPRRTMTRLVPVVVLLSFAPDLIVGFTGVQPHTTWTGIIGLMTMHLVVAAAAIVTFTRTMPLRSDEV